MYASLALYALMLSVVLLSLKKNGKNSLKKITEKLGFAKTNITDAVTTGLLYAGAMLLASIAIGMLFYSLGMSEDLSKVPNVIKSAGATQIIIIVLVGSIIEEIFFRGYLQRKTNLLFASFIFAYFHIIYGSLSELVGAFFLGAILGVSYIRSKNIFVPSIAHLTYNLVLILFTFGA